MQIGTRIGLDEVVATLGEGGPPPLAYLPRELRRGLAVAQGTRTR